MECTESEKIAAEKRDIVKAKVDEINEKLSQLSNNKKEKMKHAKKTRKCVLCLLLRLLKITVEFNTLTIDVESPTNSFGMKKKQMKLQNLVASTKSQNPAFWMKNRQKNTQ